MGSGAAGCRPASGSRSSVLLLTADERPGRRGSTRRAPPPRTRRCGRASARLREVARPPRADHGERSPGVGPVGHLRSPARTLRRGQRPSRPSTPPVSPVCRMFPVARCSPRARGPRRPARRRGPAGGGMTSRCRAWPRCGARPGRCSPQASPRPPGRRDRRPRVTTVSDPARAAGVRSGSPATPSPAAPELLLVDADTPIATITASNRSPAVAELVPILEDRRAGSDHLRHPRPVPVPRWRRGARRASPPDRAAVRMRRRRGRRRRRRGRRRDRGPDQGQGRSPVVRSRWASPTTLRFASAVAARQARSHGRRSLIVPPGPAATAAFLTLSPSPPARGGRDPGRGGRSARPARSPSARRGRRSPGADLVARSVPMVSSPTCWRAGDARPAGVQAPPPEILAQRFLDDPVHLVEPLVFPGQAGRRGSAPAVARPQGVVASRWSSGRRPSTVSAASGSGTDRSVCPGEAMRRTGSVGGSRAGSSNPVG